MKHFSSEPTSFMRLRGREASINWIMLFVLAVVIFGIALLVTNEFGTAQVPGDRQIAVSEAQSGLS